MVTFSALVLLLATATGTAVVQKTYKVAGLNKQFTGAVLGTVADGRRLQCAARCSMDYRCMAMQTTARSCTLIGSIPDRSQLTTAVDTLIYVEPTTETTTTTTAATTTISTTTTTPVTTTVTTTTTTTTSTTIAPSTTAADNGCPHVGAERIDNVCYYKISRVTIPWTEQETACKETFGSGAAIATFVNANQFQYLDALTRSTSNGFWVGARRMEDGSFAMVQSSDNSYWPSQWCTQPSSDAVYAFLHKSGCMLGFKPSVKPTLSFVICQVKL